MDPTDWKFWWSLVVSIGVGYNFWRLNYHPRPQARPLELHQVLAKQVPEYHWTPDGMGGARGASVRFQVEVSTEGVRVYKTPSPRVPLLCVSPLPKGADLREILVDYLETPPSPIPKVLPFYPIQPSEKRSLEEVTRDLLDQIPRIFKR